VTTGRGHITGLSISHSDASIEQLEAADVESQRTAVSGLVAEAPVAEAYVLQTCNRVEAYVVTDDPEAGRAVLSAFAAGVPSGVTRWLGHEESLRHLMRVACGLESLVVGEDQILGQVRDAYTDARGAGGVGSLLEDALTKAIHVGERARTETAINEGAVSLASAAVRLAEAEVDLASADGLVIGAGEMGHLAAKSLGPRVASLEVVNRTLPHAEHVADQVDTSATARPLSALSTAMTRADVVLSATGADEPVVAPETLAAAGETFIVDMAQPRDVPRSATANTSVEVRDLDALEAVTESTQAQRQEAATAVEGIVEEEFDRLIAQFKRQRADSVISTMYESAEQVKRAELSTAFDEAAFDDEQRAVLEAMADAIVNQLLAAPTRSLRDAAEDDDWATINTAIELFDPEFGPEDVPDLAADTDPADVPPAVRDRMPDGLLEQLED
jgi:glutamyl-tRNA reductase